jgi:hypothetical protein
LASSHDDGPNMTEATANLSLEIYADQREYSVSEEIMVSAYLFNFGDDSTTVNSRLAPGQWDGPGEVAFRVAGPSGQAVPFSARVNLGRPNPDEDFSVVVPWNCVGRRYELRTYFRLDEPGRYELTAHYRNRWSGPRDRAWTGNLTSSAVEIHLRDT